MDVEEDNLDTPDYPPVIAKIPLKTPDDALDYWNRRLETVSCIHNGVFGELGV